MIGYEMYRMFYTAREGKAKRTISKKKKSSGLIDLEEEELVDKREKEQLERKLTLHCFLISNCNNCSCI